MNANKPDIGSDLARIDAHRLGERDYAEVPELSDAWFAKAQPHDAGKPRGRPKAASPKQAVNLRLSQRVLAGFRAGGPGWQTRINAALEEWLDARSGRA
ncbi:MAG TPA: BrnA antitoxin family protein [Caulobacteraceae bacterium]|jgi:uncharacterized protein (DUF4415 family)